MPISLSSRSSVADLDRLSFASLLGGIVVLGLALQVFLLMQSTTWTLELERVIALVPVVVAALVYVRNRPTAAAWEISAVAVWGLLAQWIAGITWFVVGPALVGKPSVSAALLSGAAELRLAELLRFLVTVAVFAGFYAAAASRRDRTVVSAITLLAVPVVMVVVYAIV
ncbi:hypothetical protein [Natrinema salaciae]|uniref:Uncharacterized protein n=1 Tax=Natrinema salaciae TaxID=1186196 RepID=A0A1H9BAZ8_9EURY|nr:hypothetical protein [Natrinema salaciae]SEP86176.1 hypothetical protein SAMN04489841_0691 [Natrinema salaciae]